MTSATEENRMEEKIPKNGRYRHFKGNEYEVIGIARHSETTEPMVVYRALYGDAGLYIRPYDMFASPVDREKYPAACQEYRFQEAEIKSVKEK